MGDYKLSASLEGHEDDVRDVAFPDKNLIISASRDATVRQWKCLPDTAPPAYDGLISSHLQSFVNSVAYFPPNKEFPDGLIISGGKDTVIEARSPGRAAQDNADGLLLGHAHNVCALDVSPDGGYVVSGSWDSTARIWKVGTWSCEAVLEGHGGSVWAVLAYDRETIITGCADQTVRIFHISGKLLGELKAGQDVVRALCKIPPKHPSSGDFASAGNDGIIRLWSMHGKEVAQLYGHESFIYSLAALPTGELVSSGEDRTVRIWRDQACIQTITHPAISVWAVAACSSTGDIVTGASDRKVRVFTRDHKRLADQSVLQEYEQSVQASAIPQQQVGEVNKENLPGPEFITQKSGTKEGQVQMVREDDGSVSAYQWSLSENKWAKVGTVVDAVGSSGRKATYKGKDYDYVFDVDVEDGKPPLKLPFNLSQNPYEAATKFIEDNELPISYLDQVAAFIRENTKGATLGTTSQAPAGADPWGTESRYRPGQDSSSTPQSAPPVARPKVLPQTTFLAIKTGNTRTIISKILEFNGLVEKESSSNSVLSNEQKAALEALEKPLGAALSSKPSGDPQFQQSVSSALQILQTWPTAYRLPVMDLVRLLAAASPALAASNDAVRVIAASGFEDKDRENTIMMTVRAFGNLFDTSAGQSVMSSHFDQVRAPVLPYLTTNNRNLAIAIATLYLNYAVLFTSAKQGSEAVDRSLLLMDDLSKFAANATDSEAIYRGLVAIGTLLDVSHDVRGAAVEIQDVAGMLGSVEKRFKEPRIKAVAGEIRDRLRK